MRLCVNSFKAVSLAALMAVSVSACKRPTNYVYMPKENIPQRTTVVLDSLVKEGEKISQNTDYMYLGGDTLELNKDFSQNPSKFMFIANMIARDNFNDKVCTQENNYTGYPECASSQRYNGFKNVYIDKTAIIPNSEVLTTDSTDKYIPVKYYGQINPEVSDSILKNSFHKQ